MFLFDKRWRIQEKKCKCVWGGGVGERRKSYLKSQLGNHSFRLRGHGEINFQFWFPCLLRQSHANRDGGSGCSVCLKQIVGRYFFQMNCFLDQISMLQGERGEDHKALLSQESIYSSATLTASMVLLLGSVRCKEQIELPLCQRSMACHMTC